MNNDRSFIRHEILNNITIVNFLVADMHLLEEKKEEILRHLKMVSLLTAEADMLLGKKRKFSNQEVELDQAFEAIGLMLEKQIKNKRIHLKVPKTSLMVHGDRDVIFNGLEQILLRLMESSKNIILTADPDRSGLNIKYDSDECLKVETGNLIEFLRNGPKYSDFFFLVSQRLMISSGVKIVFKKGLIELVFTK